MSVLLAARAFAHGGGFDAIAVSVAPDDPDRLSAIVDGWGVVASDDGGATWSWTCEEALGLGNVQLYDIARLTGGRMVVAAAYGGLAVVADACEETTWPSGLPEDGSANGVAAWGDGFLARAFNADEGGIYACDGDACTATDHVAEKRYPKALVRDGETWWATATDTETHEARLSRSDDGLVWTDVTTWTDGDVNPYVQLADDDTLFVWDQRRDDASSPRYLRSVDGGATFEEVLAFGSYTDPIPTLLAVGDVVVVGSNWGAQTWRSTDGGATFVEVSEDAPAVRCVAATADGALTCGDHLVDGVDLFSTVDGYVWRPVACLQSAGLGACNEGTCESLFEDFGDAAQTYGEARCDEVVGTPPGGGDAPAAGCGCATEGRGIAFAWALLAVRRRR